MQIYEIKSVFTKYVLTKYALTMSTPQFRRSDALSYFAFVGIENFA